MKKILRRPGDSWTADCGCGITYGAPFPDEEQTPGRLRQVYDVEVARCEECLEYIERRNALIPKALQRVRMIQADKLLKGKAFSQPAEFHRIMTKLCREEGLIK